MFCWRSQYCSISQFSRKNCWSTRIRIYIRFRSDFCFRSTRIFENYRFINLSLNKLELIGNRTISIKLLCFRWTLFCARSQHCSGRQFPRKNCCSTRIYFRSQSDFCFRSIRIFESSILLKFFSSKLKLIENRTTIFIKLSRFRWTLFCWRSQHCSGHQFPRKNCWSIRIRIYFRFRRDFCSWSTRIFESSGLPNLPSTLQSWSLRIVRILSA